MSRNPPPGYWRRNYSPENLPRVRQLRHDAPRAEKALWYECLKNHRTGFRFRRQYPFGPYVLDFYCPEARLAVEIDGESHLDRAESDDIGDQLLEKHGIETLRFHAYEIFESKWDVAFEIARVCCERTPSLPSPCKQEEAANT